MLSRAKSLQSSLTLCDPMDCGPPGCSVHGTLQARILEWVAMPSSRGSSRPRDRNRVSYVSCMGRQVLAVLLKCCEKQLYLVLSSAAIQGKFWQMSTFILQWDLENQESLSCIWLFVTPWTVAHGILQARILAWVAFPFFRASSQPRGQIQV